MTLYVWAQPKAVLPDVVAVVQDLVAILVRVHLKVVADVTIVLHLVLAPVKTHVLVPVMKNVRIFVHTVAVILVKGIPPMLINNLERMLR